MGRNGDFTATVNFRKLASIFRKKNVPLPTSRDEFVSFVKASDDPQLAAWALEKSKEDWDGFRTRLRFHAKDGAGSA